MIVSKVIMITNSSDGTWKETTHMMPLEIATAINCLLIDWKDQWVATTNTVEEFQNSMQKFEIELEKQAESYRVKPDE